MPAQNTHITPGLPELQSRIAAGDQSAFTQVFLHFSARLTQFAFSLVRSHETAEELVEDVFVKLWANRSEADRIDNLTVYLYVAVKNTALNALSRKARELVAAPFDQLNIAVEGFAADPYELMITAEMMHKMQAAIDELPPRCKMIFKLIREDGLKYREVAEILNISVNTIDAQMAIAVRKICQSLHIDKPDSPGKGRLPEKKSKKD